MWSFNKHKKARFGYDNEHLDAHPELVTYMNFNQWKAFYMGDPEHWNIIENSNTSYYQPNYRIPMYRMNKRGYWENRYVKFLTAEDYRKFNTFIDDQAAKGEDYENLQEIAEFAEVIGEIAKRRVEKAQLKTEQAIKETKQQMVAAQERLKKQIKIDEQGRFVWE